MKSQSNYEKRMEVRDKRSKKWRNFSLSSIPKDISDYRAYMIYGRKYKSAV